MTDTISNGLRTVAQQMLDGSDPTDLRPEKQRRAPHGSHWLEADDALSGQMRAAALTNPESAS